MNATNPSLLAKIVPCRAAAISRAMNFAAQGKIPNLELSGITRLRQSGYQYLHFTSFSRVAQGNPRPAVSVCARTLDQGKDITINQISFQHALAALDVLGLLAWSPRRAKAISERLSAFPDPNYVMSRSVPNMWLEDNHDIKIMLLGGQVSFKATYHQWDSGHYDKRFTHTNLFNAIIIAAGRQLVLNLDKNELFTPA
ncbi:MAG: hypothetical protein NTZ10_06995 [Candidatus Saganbacteria bacterium]|nr:hypothetical protein [Candidatus Saganbacteria bacterium]